MPRIQLRLYVNPEEAEIICNVRRENGTYERLAAIVDTGATVSLVPDDLLSKVSYRLSERGSFTIEQAGIARQSFEAVEAYITVFLEDESGQHTHPFEVPVWFAPTRKSLIVFDGILNRAILHIDMLEERRGWIDINA